MSIAISCCEKGRNNISLLPLHSKNPQLGATNTLSPNVTLAQSNITVL